MTDFADTPEYDETVYMRAFDRAVWAYGHVKNDHGPQWWNAYFTACIDHMYDCLLLRLPADPEVQKNLRDLVVRAYEERQKAHDAGEEGEAE